MLDMILAKIFGTKTEREIKAIRPLITAINGLEEKMKALSDVELAAKTIDFKERLARGASLDDLLPEAFAAVREAGRRVLNMRHFDVQLIGGVMLHKGSIAEMGTGEGKTLVATLPCYLNALSGLGVHVVTVNDYLAKRDAEWMGRLYNFMGLSSGTVVHERDDAERRQSYASDITYGTNNEYGFDYLRDNMKFRLENCVQRGHNYAIVDEVDSILIDEARTPLIISGPSEESTDKYYKLNRVVPKLIRGEVIEGKEPGEKYFTGDYTVDEKHRGVALTEEGIHKLERLLQCGNLYDPANIETNHHVQQALKAHVLFHRDKDYLVRPGEDGEPEVMIVDEFTGRIMPGRRWSDGLHQAVEAKEGVKIQRESQTLASITYQNYFRLYKKLAGMTGTAETEAAEFGKTYKIDVSIIPPNRVRRRTDTNDVVYRTEEEKFRNAALEIKDKNEKGQPVLVGTISVVKSEKLGDILKKMGVPHEVLNAKNHEREASIVAQAGRKGAVTVSTNMAGRGTDILLGGNPDFLTREKLRKQGIDPDHCEKEQWDAVYKEVKQQTDAEHDEVVASGGLHIIGTERHESRRIDNQLRGRSGRQGDPGSSKFFLSLQDELLRIFGGDKMQNLMLRLGMEEDVPIESRLISKRIASAQKAVEAQHFASRKHVLEYDDVLNKQRQAVYSMRRSLLEGVEQKARVMEIVEGIVGFLVDERIPEKAHPDAWELAELESDVLSRFGVKCTVAEMKALNRSQIEEMIKDRLRNRYDEKESVVGAGLMREAEQMIMLKVIDDQWKDHMLSMDHLKEGINLRGYGQKDPLIEYKKESFTMFQDMMDRIEDESVRYLYFLQVEDNSTAKSLLPFDPDVEDGEPGDDEEDAVAVEVGSNNRKPNPAAQSSIEDFTRNIAKKKEREMEALQFVGGSTASEPQHPMLAKKTPGRNDPCWCGSGKKFKKCHG